uniref:Photosystem I reaction center subunit XII n=1 Tax=Pinus lambertiana TaxID=3343 RepID=C3W1E3_PINLA|nr:photosystem I protein M [Pinus lambertiana]
MIIEVQILIAFFLAFTASILALKLGQALYE